MSNYSAEIELVVGNLAEFKSKITDVGKKTPIEIDFDAGNIVKRIETIKKSLYETETITTALNSKTGEWERSIAKVTNEIKKAEDLEKAHAEAIKINKKLELDRITALEKSHAEAIKMNDAYDKMLYTAYKMNEAFDVAHMTKLHTEALAINKSINKEHQEQIKALAYERTEQEKILALKQQESQLKYAKEFGFDNNLLEGEDRRKYELFWVEKIDKAEEELYRKSVNRLREKEKLKQEAQKAEIEAMDKIHTQALAINDAYDKNSNSIDVLRTRLEGIKLTSEQRAMVEQKIAEIMAMQDPKAQQQALRILNAEISNMSKSAGGLEESLKRAFLQFVSYQAVIRILRDMVDSVVELDTSLVELKKVTDLEGASLDAYIEKAFKLGEAVGRTGKEVIDATTIFARSGYAIKEALDLAETALVMTNVGDGIKSVEDAATSLIAIMKAYNIDVSESTKITDLLNEVSNNTAIDFATLTDGIQRAGAVYAQSGTSIEELAGLLTGTNEILQNMERSSKGLVTISQRLRGLKDIGEDGYEGISKLSSEFERLTQGRLTVFDDNGQLRDTFDILKDMQAILPTLSENARQYLMELSAGYLRLNLNCPNVQKCA